jgi:hypothetical protein
MSSSPDQRIIEMVELARRDDPELAALVPRERVGANALVAMPVS